jgi:RNA polymerase primary sigma factor
MEVLCDPRAVTPDQDVANRDDIITIQRLLDAIDHREATILRLRFGLEGDEPLTLKEVGKRVGLTRERVRQIEIEALNKLNRRLQSRNPFSDEHEPPKRRQRRTAAGNGAARSGTRRKPVAPSAKTQSEGEAA